MDNMNIINAYKDKMYVGLLVDSVNLHKDINNEETTDGWNHDISVLMLTVDDLDGADDVLLTWVYGEFESVDEFLEWESPEGLNEIATKLYEIKERGK